MIFCNFRKIFGSVQKCSEIFGNFRKRFKRDFMIFLKFSKNLWKSSEVFGYHKKFSRGDRKCSQWLAEVEKCQS